MSRAGSGCYGAGLLGAAFGGETLAFIARFGLVALHTPTTTHPRTHPHTPTPTYAHIHAHKHTQAHAQHHTHIHTHKYTCPYTHTPFCEVHSCIFTHCTRGGRRKDTSDSYPADSKTHPRTHPHTPPIPQIRTQGKNGWYGATHTIIVHLHCDGCTGHTSDF